jgi:hypothetical protein
MVCITGRKTTASYAWVTIVGIDSFFFSASVVLDGYYYQMWKFISLEVNMEI